MSVLKWLLQIAGIVMLIPAAAMLTLKIDKQNEDGPSILFPGGPLVSGELHTGPEPDWRFTDEVSRSNCRFVEPLSSRRIFIMESDGKSLRSVRIHAFHARSHLEGLGVPG